MKLTTTLLYASLLIGTANAFVERSSVRARNTALAGGFLDGKSFKSAQYFCNLGCLIWSSLIISCIARYLHLCGHNLYRKPKEVGHHAAGG